MKYHIISSIGIELLRETAARLKQPQPLTDSERKAISDTLLSVADLAEAMPDEVAKTEVEKNRSGVCPGDSRTPARYTNGSSNGGADEGEPMAVEWHECDGYRLSFDVRSDASRFIVVRGDNLISKGLIDEHRVLYDREPAQRPPVHVERALVAKWQEMRARELAKERSERLR